MSDAVEHAGDSSKHNLTNDDFRRLLTSNAGSGGGGGGSSSKPSSGGTFSHRGHTVEIHSSKSKTEKKSKHGFYKKQKDEEDNLLHILKKYRDRAKERRQDSTTDNGLDLLQTTSGYRAVAPDLKTNLDAAERRKQLIEESKYLGGDMEHTHLVKGLDYALLQKVRSEIMSKQKEDDVEAAYQSARRDDEEADLQFKSKFARNIYRVLFRNELPKVNELFAPKRMAYVTELDDEFTESEIPTTLIRSKAECPINETASTLTPNDVVIQKLTQVLSYLRADTRKKKKDKGKDQNEVTETTKDQSIYDDVGQYVPSLSKSVGPKQKKESYFDSKAKEEARAVYVNSKSMGTEKDRDRSRAADGHKVNRQSGPIETSQYFRDKVDSRLGSSFAAETDVKRSQKNDESARKDEKSENAKRDHDPLSLSNQMKTGVRLDARDAGSSYAECFPDTFEGFDHVVDSDDEEADFSKMDLGNKKGPVRRWDFDTEQEYEEYMSRREAMPKAAFQYGVKMNDGRKTRKTQGGKNEKDEKAKLDREWQKIQNLISKRKGDSGSSAKRAKVDAD